jgi:hypothetical protein
MEQHRDKSGKLIAYTTSSDEKITIEVIIEKISGRMDRIESNLADIKIHLDEKSSDLKILGDKITKLAEMFREMTVAFHAVLKSNEDTIAACKENTNDALRIRTGITVFKWIGGVTLGIAAIAGTIYEIFFRR